LIPGFLLTENLHSFLKGCGDFFCGFPKMPGFSTFFTKEAVDKPVDNVEKCCGKGCGECGVFYFM
jgi:hypothetical protein